MLGSEPAWPSAGRACSGYLVRTREGLVLIDCGTGVFERLRGVVAPEALTAVVISHLHFDHWADLIPFRYYLSFEARPDIPPRLYLPPGASQTLQSVIEPIDPAPRFFGDAFRSSEYDPDDGLLVGGLRISFHRTVHPIDTYALRLESGGKVIVYSADTGWDESLAAFARGADLFLCESTWAGGQSREQIHLTGREAGRLAALASARKLLLTHVDEAGAQDSVRAAAAEYAGPVEHAGAGLLFRA